MTQGRVMVLPKVKSPRSKSQCTHKTKISIFFFGTMFLICIVYIKQLASMTKRCVMTLTKGHIS